MIILRTINFDEQPKLHLKIKVNGIERDIDINSDYETQNLTFPELTFQRKILANNTKIPRNIAQTYESRNVTRRKYLSVRSVIDRNPGYNYKFYDSAERANFIKEHFSHYVYNAYNKLIPGTYKADFFRFCFLYIYGGIYMDCKLVCIQSYENLITSGDDMVFAQDIMGKIYYQTAFMAAAPGIEPLKKLIDLVVNNIYTRYYGGRSLDPTGPGALYKAVSPYAHNNSSNFKINVIKFVCTEQSLHMLVYKDHVLGELAYFIYPYYYEENGYGKKNYGYYYDKKWIYQP